jgi:hypothetical protein
MENPLLWSGLALAGANWKNKGFTPPLATVASAQTIHSRTRTS